jgi:hypothetical protein
MAAVGILQRVVFGINPSVSPLTEISLSALSAPFDVITTCTKPVPAGRSSGY